MKKSFLLLALVSVFHAYRAIAEPFNESKGWVYYKLSNPIINKFMPPGNMSVDEYVVSVSQKSAINIIADVTNISAGDWVKKFPYGPTAVARKWTAPPEGVVLEAALRDFEEAERVSELRYDETTYLLWNKPDALETARLIVASGKQRPAEPLPNEATLYDAFYEYAKSPLKWRGRAGYRYTRTPLAEVPPDLRAQIKAVERHELFASRVASGISFHGQLLESGSNPPDVTKSVAEFRRQGSASGFGRPTEHPRRKWQDNQFLSAIRLSLL